MCACAVARFRHTHLPARPFSSRNSPLWYVARHARPPLRLLHSGHEDICGEFLRLFWPAFSRLPPVLPAQTQPARGPAQRARAAASAKGPLSDRIEAILADPSAGPCGVWHQRHHAGRAAALWTEPGAPVHSRLERQAHHHGRGLRAAAGGYALLDHQRCGRRRSGLIGRCAWRPDPARGRRPDNQRTAIPLSGAGNGRRRAKPEPPPRKSSRTPLHLPAPSTR